MDKTYELARHLYLRLAAHEKYITNIGGKNEIHYH